MLNQVVHYDRQLRVEPHMQFLIWLPVLFLVGPYPLESWSTKTGTLL